MLLQLLKHLQSGYAYAAALSWLGKAAMIASTIAEMAGEISLLRRYRTHCASLRSMRSPAAFSRVIWRDMRDWVTPSWSTKSQTQYSSPSHTICSARSRVGSERALSTSLIFTSMNFEYAAMRINAIAMFDRCAHEMLQPAMAAGKNQQDGAGSIRPGI